MRSDSRKKLGDARWDGGAGALRSGKQVTVRLACDRDADALAAILPMAHRWDSPSRVGWENPDHLRFILLSIATGRARTAHFTVIVAEDEGRTVGALIYRYGVHKMDGGGAADGAPYPDAGVVDALAVHPDARRQGVGTAMMKWAEADLRVGSRVMTLQCPESARGFYEALWYHVEDQQVAAVTFFPRQGQNAWTSFRPEGDPTARLAWKSLNGARARIASYTHPSQGEPGMMVRGLIPGDGRRHLDWPAKVR